tara:strand:- start:170 stop:634 length:465 start_codon:yes stop_codon:yes gene_type:complete
MEKNLKNYLDHIIAPQPKLDGLAICPYLKKYLKSVKWGYADDEQTIVINNILIVEEMQKDKGSTFIWICKWDIDYGELHNLRQRQQQLYKDKDIEFLYIGKGQGKDKTPLKGIKYSYDHDSLLVMQRRSTLLNARKELAKTTKYYDLWQKLTQA